MAEEVGALSVRLEATAARFERDMQRATRSMDRAAGKMTRRAGSLDQRMQRVGSRFGVAIPGKAALVAGAIAAVGLAISGVIQAGDRMKLLEGQFTALTGSAERAETALAAAFDIADEVGVAVDVVGNLQARFLLIADDIGATDGEVATLTETLLKMGRVGGSSATEISSASVQLSQGLAAGALRGEELNSILENMPLVAQAIAEEFDVGVGALKEMGSEGELVADRVLAAILNGSEKINGQFKELPQTVEQAGSRMQTAFGRAAAELDKALGLSDGLVSAMNAAADAAGAYADALERANTASASDEVQNDATRLGRRTTTGARVRLPVGVLDANDPRGIGGDQAGNVPMSLGRFGVVGSPSGAPLPVRRGTLDQLSNDQLAADLAVYGRSSGKPGQPGLPEDRGGSSRRSAAPRADDVDRSAEALKRLTEQMERQQGALGKTGVELAVYEAKQEAANAIAEAGADLTDAQRATLEALAAEYINVSIATAEAQEAMQAQQEATERSRQAVEDLTGTFADAIAEADSLGEAVKRVAVRLAELAIADLNNNGGSGISSIFETIAGGLAGSLGGASASPSVATVGSRYASGTSYARGGLSLVGENGPEIVNMPRGAQVTDAARTRQMMRSGGESVIRVELSGDLDARVTSQAEDVAVRVVRAGIGQYDRNVLPSRVAGIRADPRRR